MIDHPNWFRFLRLSAASLALLTASCSIEQPPVTVAERKQNLEQDIKETYQDQVAVIGPISLYDAMARAVAYNLDHRVKMMEAAVANGQYDVSKFDLLPQLAANAGYNVRDSDLLTTSKNPAGFNVPSTGQTSEDRRRGTVQLNVMFNILDFGVSYARARQESNGILIAEERRKRLVQTIIEDVRSAYWRAVSAQMLGHDIDRLIKVSETALDRARAIERDQLQPPLKVLDYQKQVVQTLSQLSQAKRDLGIAKVELAALMNLPPDTKYDVVEPSPDDELQEPATLPPIEVMENVALVNRPELREEDLQARNGDLDIFKAQIQQFPSLGGTLGINYDSNSYLVNKVWQEAAVSASMNLFKLFSGPAGVDLARAQKSVEDAKRRALNVAVFTQVEVGYAKLGIVAQEYGFSVSESEIDSKLAFQANGAYRSGVLDELEVIRNDGNALVARLRRDQSFAALQNAIGHMYTAIGIDPLPDTLPSADLTTLSAALRAAYSKPLGERLNELAAQQGAGPLQVKPVAVVEVPPPEPVQVAVIEPVAAPVPEPAPVEPVIARAPEPVIAPVHGKFVQLAAESSENAAAADVHSFKAKFAELKSVGVSVEKGTTIYHVLAGPVATKAGAEALCRSLKAQKQECFVRKG